MWRLRSLPIVRPPATAAARLPRPAAAQVLNRLGRDLPIVPRVLTAISNDPQAYGWLDLNIVESIRGTNVTAGNVIVVDILDEVKDAVQRGEQVWVTLAKHPLVVPPLASPMLAIIGQSSG